MLARGTYDFASAIAKSTSWSQVVMDHLRSIGRQVDDKTEDLQYQHREIDFLLGGKGVEFKTCDRIQQTGNVAYELVSNSRKGTPGACLYSEADYLFYLSTVQSVCYMIDLPKLRLAIEHSPQTKWSAYKVTTAKNGGGILYATFGLLVPLDFVRKCGAYVGHFVVKKNGHGNSAN